MSLSLNFEQRMKLWCANPHYEAMMALDAEANGAKDLETLHLVIEKMRLENPMPRPGSRDIEALRGRIKPAKIEKNEVRKVTEEGMTNWDTAFGAARAESKLLHPKLIGRYITFHFYGHATYFKPSIGEVLSQLPQEILDRKETLYFTTEPIAENPRQCKAGNLHVGVTSVFEEGA